jgi:hypothetical protein
MAATHYVTLTDAILSAGIPEELDQPALLELLRNVIDIGPDTHPFAVVAAEDALAATGQGTPVLEVRPGGWVVNTTSSLARAAVTAAVMTAVMYAGGFNQIPAYVLPAVLPLVVDLDRVKLSRGDRKLLALLRVNAGATAGQPVDTDVLYNRLPANVRPEVSPLDFADFVDRLITAGEADDPGFDDVVLRDQPRWIRITLA